MSFHTGKKVMPISETMRYYITAVQLAASARKADRDPQHCLQLQQPVTALYRTYSTASCLPELYTKYLIAELYGSVAQTVRVEHEAYR